MELVNRAQAHFLFLLEKSQAVRKVKLSLGQALWEGAILEEIVVSNKKV